MNHIQNGNGTQNVEQRLQSIKDRIERGRQEKARAEATLEQLNKQRQEVLAELAELGVTEDQLADEIARLEKEISDALAEAEAALPAEQDQAAPTTDPQPHGAQGMSF